MKKNVGLSLLIILLFPAFAFAGPTIYYHFVMAKHSFKMLSVGAALKTDGANVIQWQLNDNGSDDQKWQIIPAGGGAFQFVAKHSKMVLSVAGAERKEGANIVQSLNQRRYEQLWKLEPAGGGYYYIVSKHSNKYLSVSNQKKDNGTNIVQWSNLKNDAQKWLIVLAEVVR